jgi:transcriptional regulator NrdR family protein
VLFTTFNKEESINQNGNKDERYELEIESLRSEIQRSREEKKVYISQIEDIIQQITRR